MSRSLEQQLHDRVANANRLTQPTAERLEALKRERPVPRFYELRRRALRLGLFSPETRSSTAALHGVGANDEIGHIPLQDIASFVASAAIEHYERAVRNDPEAQSREAMVHVVTGSGTTSLLATMASPTQQIGLLRSLHRLHFDEDTSLLLGAYTNRQRPLAIRQAIGRGFEVVGGRVIAYLTQLSSQCNDNLANAAQLSALRLRELRPYAGWPSQAHGSNQIWTMPYNGDPTGRLADYRHPITFDGVTVAGQTPRSDTPVPPQPAAVLPAEAAPVRAPAVRRIIRDDD